MPAIISWTEPPARRSLSPGQLHVWRTWLDRPPEDRARLASSLAPEERARADRLRFEQDRARFVVGRGVLRAILGSYLGLAPGAVPLDYGSHGKPFLAGPGGPFDLRFNLAHSQGLALYALAAGREVGIDVEAVRPLAQDAGDIVERFFSDRERSMYAALPAEAKPLAFYLCWTRKEAFLKALGPGLARPLNSFSVSLHPGQRARLLEVQGEPAMAERWTLVGLEPAPGYVAALAIEGSSPRLTGWHLGPDRPPPLLGPS